MNVRAMSRRMGPCIMLLLGWLTLTAHVGSNQVVFEGRAGGYPVRVMITPSGVVPAQVPILIRVLEGTPTRITVRAAQWNVGTRGAPPAEEAAGVPGDPGVWAHDLWIMTSSTYAVHVAVYGPAGGGTFVVPMQTSATRTLGMSRAMGGILTVLGALLVAGVLTIVGAATREGSLPAGQTATPLRQRSARIAMATTAGVLALALLGGSKWWAAEEAAYRRSLYRPIRSETTVRTVDDTRVLTLAITDSLWKSNRVMPLMPDHGKLMHLFLIRANDASAIAHLHPLRVHADTFTTRLPALPEGQYFLFADILLQSGTQRTLVDTIDLPVAPVVAGEARAAASGGETFVPTLDTDDAWRALSAVALGASSPLSGGGSITLTADAMVVASRDLRLTAAVRDANGAASVLEPYMGMGGHAMVLRTDGGVFMHLHPMGTASMTAQAQLLRRERGDTARLDSTSIAAAIGQLESNAMHNSAGASGTVAFPFAFPTPGEYRVFVQVKRRGTVETASFTVLVPAPSNAN